MKITSTYSVRLRNFNRVFDDTDRKSTRLNSSHAK